MQMNKKDKIIIEFLEIRIYNEHSTKRSPFKYSE